MHTTPQFNITVLISIHALHEESDACALQKPAKVRFQSTLSMRRATHYQPFSKTFHYISIHALHEESDMLSRSMRD